MRDATLFTGARLITGDGSPATEDGAILVRDGLIEAVGGPFTIQTDEPVRRVDMAGKTVMPTIVNPHGHIGYQKDGVTDSANFSRENVIDHLRRLSYYGISVFQSLGTDRDDIEISIRDGQRDGTLADPELALLFSAATGLAAPTPGETNGGAFFAPDAIREASTPEEARLVVREIGTKKPDVIKFWLDTRDGTKEKFTPRCTRPSSTRHIASVFAPLRTSTSSMTPKASSGPASTEQRAVPKHGRQGQITGRDFHRRGREFDNGLEVMHKGG